MRTLIVTLVLATCCYGMAAHAQEATLTSGVGTLGLRAYAKSNLKGSKPLSVQDDTTCQHSYVVSHLLSHDRQYAAAYDTSKSFVERCPTDIHASGAFGDMAVDVDYGGNGPLPAGALDFRQWLLTALAWNPHSYIYFCSDVHAMTGTFGNYDTSYVDGNTATNKAMSVLYWILHNPLCYNSSDSELYANGRGTQESIWIDTQDTSKVPLDTTIYSMHDLGLDSVLIYAAMLGVHSGSGCPILFQMPSRRRTRWRAALSSLSAQIKKRM